MAEDLLVLFENVLASRREQLARLLKSAPNTAQRRELCMTRLRAG
jgi:hypothetical protein